MKGRRERGPRDVITVPRVGTNIRLQAVAAAPATSSHCHPKQRPANSRELSRAQRRGGPPLFPAKKMTVITGDRKCDYHVTKDWYISPRDRYSLIIGSTRQCVDHAIGQTHSELRPIIRIRREVGSNHPRTLRALGPN